MRDAETRYQADDGSLLERKRLGKRLHDLDTERERLLVLYRRGTLDVARWAAPAD